VSDNRTAPQSFPTTQLPHPVMRTIRWVLAAVCVADIALGLLILFVPQLLLRLFGIPLPDEMLWFQLIGLMLLPGAIDGLVGLRRHDRYISNVIVSAGARLATAAFLLVVASVRNVPWILIALAVGEAVVGCLTVIYLSRIVRVPRIARPAA